MGRTRSMPTESPEPTRPGLSRVHPAVEQFGSSLPPS